MLTVLWGRSFSTQLSFAALAFLLALPARAEMPEEAALSKGYNDYFDALMEGKAQDRSDMERLREQTIAPAERAVNQAFDRKWRAAIEAQLNQPAPPPSLADELLRKKLASLKGPELPEPPASQAPIPLFGPAHAGSSSGFGSAAPAAPAPSYIGHPAPGLDGSKVPRLLEFPKKR